MSIITLLYSAVIFLYSVWACLSHQYDDGVIGKFLFSATSLVALAVFLTGNHADWLNIAFALLCIRNFAVALVMPAIIKKYPCLDRRKKNE